MSMILLIAIAVILVICMLAWFTLSRKYEPDYSPDYSKEAEELPDEKFSDKDSGQRRELYVCPDCNDNDCACHLEDNKETGK